MRKSYAVSSLFKIRKIKHYLGNMKRSLERWNDIFPDPVMTATMIDRLTHKAFIVNMNGNSYRYKETEEWLKFFELCVRFLN